MRVRQRRHNGTDATLGEGDAVEGKINVRRGQGCCCCCYCLVYMYHCPKICEVKCWSEPLSALDGLRIIG